MVKFVYDWDKEKKILEWPRKRYPQELFARWKDWIDSEDPNQFLKVEELVKDTERLWIKIEPQFLKALATFFEIEKASLPNLEVTAYLTRLRRHPFNRKKGNYWFGMPLYDLPEMKLRVIAHELTHLYMFDMHGDDLAREFNEKMIDNIKEVAATLAVCTHFQSFLKGIKERVHDRNKEFASYVSGKIKDPQDPKFKEILELAKSYTAS